MSNTYHLLGTLLTSSLHQNENQFIIGVTNPNHHHGNSERSSISFNKRRDAVLGMIFNQEDALQSLTDAVVDHLKNHGLTTIVYRPNPLDASKMMNVLSCWLQLNLPSVRTDSIVRKTKWNDYDIENDKSSVRLCEINHQNVHQEELYAPITINNL